MADQFPQEQSIYLKSLLQKILRQWRSLVLFMLVGAILLGGYQAFAPLNVPALDEDAVKNLDSQIKDCQESMLSNAQKREDNLLTMSEKRTTIQTLQEDLLSEESYLALCRETLEQVQVLLEDASGESRIALLSQFTTLNDDIRKAKSSMEQIKNSITSNEKDIQRLTRENSETIVEANRDLMDKLSDLRLQKEQLENASNPALVIRSKKKIVVFAVVGMILGACLRAGWVYFKILSSHKLQTPDELISGFGVPDLGSVKDPKNRDFACQMAIAQLGARVQSGQEVIVTGTLPLDTLQEICTRLQAHAERFSLRAVGNPVQDAQSTQAVQNAQVILVESIGVSDFFQVSNLLQVLKLCNASVLGFLEQ